MDAGLRNVGAIHRGFADFSDSVYRNPPHWEVARKMRAEIPGMPMIVDPSHMAGKRALIPGLMRQAADLGFNAFYDREPHKSGNGPDRCPSAANPV